MNEPLLWLIVLAALLAPFASKAVEDRIELFILLLGIVAVSLASLWTRELVGEAFRAAVPVGLTVLAFGVAFRFVREQLDHAVRRAQGRIPGWLFRAGLVAVLGLVSSVITAIIAAIVLVEMLRMMRTDRRTTVRLAVLSCFAIGLGSALTPLGGPLSAVASMELGRGFWFLACSMGPYIIPGVLALAVVAARLRPGRPRPRLAGSVQPETVLGMALTAAGVVAFVVGLVLLGAGLSGLFEKRVMGLPPAALYWVNMISAALDNATLAAIELNPSVAGALLSALLLGLLVSGGMLIPGNIPNIIAAKHLKIGSREWARYGVPVGLALLPAYFAAWLLVSSAG